MYTWYINLSALQTKTFFVNTVDPDETAQIELSLQDLHYLPFCFDF